MAVLGADPDAPERPWGVEDDQYEDKVTYSAVLKNSGPVGEMVRYFVWHPKTTLNHIFDNKDFGALTSSIKRLLEGGYDVAGVKMAINRFYTTDTAFKHPHPALAFTNKDFQSRLLAGATVEPKDEVMLFLSNGMTRDRLMDLPWGEDFDDELKSEFMSDPELVALTMTYPDMVASVLVNLEDRDQLWTVLDALIRQWAWSDDRGPKVPEDLLLLKSIIPVIPRSLTSRSKQFNRPRQKTFEDAVREAQSG